ncbi:hypothetical protein ACTID9_14640 [Brevibacillus fluminis]|uniref:hypothetical protein n=1 Tax=Brevibacillus fluminis TaxID=511487 RepID=UPI003F899142
MPKQPAASREQLSPEFVKWLRTTKNMRTKQISRQPELVKQYQKEFARESAPRRERRGLLPFSMPNLSMMDILNHVNRAQQVLSVIQNLQTVLPTLGAKGLPGSKNIDQ